MILGTGVHNNKPCKDRCEIDVRNGFGRILVSVVMLLCLCANSWGACNSSSTRSSYVDGLTNSRYTIHLVDNYCVIYRDGVQYSSSTFLGCRTDNNYPVCTMNSCVKEDHYVRGYYTQCSTQAEADSVYCENNPGAEGCGPVQDTETMEQLQSRCNAIDGVAHYQFNDDGNVVGYCDICQTDENGNYTNPHVKTQYDDYKSSCCEIGKAPNKSNFSCKSDANACVGANCDWLGDPSVTEGGGIGYSKLGYTPGICAVNVSTNIDGTIQGCEDDSEEINSSDSENPNSSSSDNPASGSSTSQDSLSMDENVAAIAQGVGEILDSLHKIIVIDSMNRTYDSLVAVFTSTIASLVDEINQKEFGGGDTTIINVPRDTNIVNVNVGQAAVVSAIESMSVTQQATAQVALAKSDTTNDILRGILGALQQGDTSSVYNDSNIVNILTDTTGQSYGDTAGWGAKLDSIGTWLNDSTFLKNIFGSGSGALCDTTGGKKCASMGGSLDSAGGSWGGTYKALGDSLTGGVVGDSLRHWESMLTNNGVITGSGSNACPSVFSRQFEINIGQSISIQTPALGQYICANIPGTGITFWTLARVFIRAMVAITCMWWLYGAVTGVKSDGGDDD